MVTNKGKDGRQAVVGVCAKTQCSRHDAVAENTGDRVGSDSQATGGGVDGHKIRSRMGDSEYGKSLDIVTEGGNETGNSLGYIWHSR